MAALSKGIRSSELSSVSSQERKKLIDELFQAALNPTQKQLENQLEEINTQIREFERRYELPSDIMLQRLSEDSMKETAEICSWLMLLKLRKQFDGCKSFSRT